MHYKNFDPRNAMQKILMYLSQYSMSVCVYLYLKLRFTLNTFAYTVCGLNDDDDDDDGVFAETGWSLPTHPAHPAYRLQRLGVSNKSHSRPGRQSKMAVSSLDFINCRNEEKRNETAR